MTYLYHRVHPDMQGHTLFPLNQLKDKYPEIYETRKEKYEGREYLLELEIEPLHCLWNDVLFLSPVHPEKIKSALMEAGRKEAFEHQYYQIDIHTLDKENIAVYSYLNIVKNLSLSPGDYVEFSPEAIAEYNYVPETTKQYFRDTYEQGGKPLLYAGIPHILYKGTIDISDVPIVSV